MAKREESAAVRWKNAAAHLIIAVVWLIHCLRGIMSRVSTLYHASSQFLVHRADKVDRGEASLRLRSEGTEVVERLCQLRGA